VLRSRFGFTEETLAGLRGHAVWNTWNPTKATWGTKRREWSGWATDNPNNNYYSSFLEATMLLGLAARGEHPRADEWVKAFREKRLGDELFPTYDARSDRRRLAGRNRLRLGDAPAVPDLRPVGDGDRRTDRRHHAPDQGVASRGSFTRRCRR
jgi:hypothetical protein